MTRILKLISSLLIIISVISIIVIFLLEYFDFKIPPAFMNNSILTLIISLPILSTINYNSRNSRFKLKYGISKVNFDKVSINEKNFTFNHWLKIIRGILIVLGLVSFLSGSFMILFGFADSIENFHINYMLMVGIIATTFGITLIIYTDKVISKWK